MFRIYVSIYIQVNKGRATNEERSDTNDKLDCFFKRKCSDLAAPRAARDQLVLNMGLRNTHTVQQNPPIRLVSFEELNKH